MSEQESGERGPVDKHEPNPGPSITHDFDCTHDPCRCGDQLATLRVALSHTSLTTSQMLEVEALLVPVSHRWCTEHRCTLAEGLPREDECALTTLYRIADPKEASDE